MIKHAITDETTRNTAASLIDRSSILAPSNLNQHDRSRLHLLLTGGKVIVYSQLIPANRDVSATISKTGRDVKYFIIFLLLLAIILISLTLGIQNHQIVDFDFLLAKGQYRLSTLLASLFAMGFILGWLICGLFWLRVKLRLVSLERKIKRLERQQNQD